MACGAPSAARAWVSPARPNLVAQYADALAQPRRPATEETLTIVPPPAALMRAATRSRPARLRASSATRAPSSASCTAVASPSPLLAPVAIASWPFTSGISFSRPHANRAERPAYARLVAGEPGTDCLLAALVTALG